MRTVLKMSLETLPSELLIEILQYLPLNTLLNGLALVSTQFYYLVQDELLRLKIDMEIDGDTYQTPPSASLSKFNIRKLVLKNVLKPQELLMEVQEKSCSLVLDHCGIRELSLQGLPFHLNGLHFGLEDHLPTRIYEELAKSTIGRNGSQQVMTSLTLPQIPPMFVPLILANHGNITELEVSQCTNPMVHYICKNLKSLQKFAFVGEALTYSGIVGLHQRQASLKVLQIRNPCLLTKYSLKLLAVLTNLTDLKLYWMGKFLINNPWNFEFCLDREVQRIDNLVENGLTRLVSLDLSAFYQTVDDKSMQSLAYHHLSSNSLCQNHLKTIHLPHCYHLTDNGIQWLIGSCHSTKIQTLDFSNTNLTGNCFLRKMPYLNHLKLDGCVSLNGSGLVNIAASCSVLNYLSISMNKQLIDEDLTMAFKNGLKNLKEFQANYVNINGSCFRNCQFFTTIRKLSLHSCPKINENHGLIEFLQKTKNLAYLDLSATGLKSLTCSLKNLKRLYVDFCSFSADAILNRMEKDFPCLRLLSIFGSVNLDLASQEHDLMIRVVKSLGTESENQLRDFATRRGIKLNNWAVTRNSMVKGVPFMLSQIRLTSVEN